MPGRESGSGRAAGLAALGLMLLVGACRQPAVGERAGGAAFAPGPRIAIEEAWLDVHGHVNATFSTTEEDLPLDRDELDALQPRFTLATLSDHPVDGLRAWKSALLTGWQQAASLPPSGPGTPAGAILTSARQPGYVTPASLVDLGGGRYRYVFPDALTSFDPDETVRVGVWLQGAEAPTLDTSSTFDFRPSGGIVEVRDSVLDETCGRCHGTLVAHGSRSRVRLCVTCHTWQAADPDTVDPASTDGTAETDPNPLELGRLVHRIHRGKQLPTLYRSSSTALPEDPDAVTATIAPFTPSTATPLAGRKYSVVGWQSREFVFGRVLQRAENGQAPRTMATGVVFPRDLRDCEACHVPADDPVRQGAVVTTEISRRICAGCHPDVWFQGTPIAGESHRPHGGGRQDHDGACAGCHVTGTPRMYVPIADAHVVPRFSPRSNRLEVEIVRVEDLLPGAAPRVAFKLRDDVGPLVPTMKAPVPLNEPGSSPPVSRAFTATDLLFVRVSGPTSPDYGDVQLASGAWGTGHPDATLLTADPATDEYVYSFSSTVGTIPQGATGTWTVAVEARRVRTVPRYDAATDRFLWPYTGESVYATPRNAVVHVDVGKGKGAWPPDGSVRRRRIVAQEKCLRCHGERFVLHGGLRNEVEFCLTCHTPNLTDWAQRPKSGGKVNLAATLDGIEERSVHFKVLIHRIHTGGRKGSASLEGIEPHVIYGYGQNPMFFDEGLFPADLRNCTLCHEGKSYLVEAVPADAAPTVANETATLRHDANSVAHVVGERSVPPVQAACTGCHASGATLAHVEAKTVRGVETCAQCHAKGPVSVDVAHGLAPASGGVGTTFSSILQEVLVPRCASAACHSGSPPVAFPSLDADVAYGAIVGVPSLQSSLKIVEPGAPERSYLVYKLRGDAASVGGAVATPMPTDGLLDPADIAAIESWIANGAAND